MQTKGGGKHDILPVARATATTPDCLWMMPRDPDADMCRDTETVSVRRIRAAFRWRTTFQPIQTTAQFVASHRAVSQLGV
jgi:hypothetical protein